MAALNEGMAPNERRVLLRGALLGLAAGSLAMRTDTAVAGADNAGGKRTGLFPMDAPAADTGYSPGIAAEGARVICVSGQGPDDLKADMETQIRQTFRRIGLILAEGGASFEHIVMVRSYFLRLARDLPVFRKVRKEFLKKPYPASTAVGTTELAIPGLEFEIEAIAVV